MESWSSCNCGPVKKAGGAGLPDELYILQTVSWNDQNIQNSLARAVTPKSSHITPVLKSLHWLKINERIKYTELSLTYKVLTTHQPQYLHDSISVQPCHNTRSSSMVTLARPPTHFSLKITNRSFRYAAPCLWNELASDLQYNTSLFIWQPSASLVRHSLLLFLLSHIWQFMFIPNFIIFTIFTITACIISYSLRISFWTQDLAL